MAAVFISDAEQAHAEAWERCFAAWLSDEDGTAPDTCEGLSGALENCVEGDAAGEVDQEAWLRLGRRLGELLPDRVCGVRGLVLEMAIGHSGWQRGSAAGARAFAFIRGAIEGTLAAGGGDGDVLVHGEAHRLAPWRDAYEAFPLGYCILRGWIAAATATWGSGGVQGEAAAAHAALAEVFDDALGRLRGEGLANDHWHISFGNMALGMLGGHPDDAGLRRIVQERFGMGWPRLWGGAGIHWDIAAPISTRWGGALAIQQKICVMGGVETLGELALYNTGAVDIRRWREVFSEGVANLDGVRKGDYAAWRKSVGGWWREGLGSADAGEVAAAYSEALFTAGAAPKPGRRKRA